MINALPSQESRAGAETRSSDEGRYGDVHWIRAPDAPSRTLRVVPDVICFARAK